jgi:putative ABC transport system ATP-binding protein
MVFQSFNLFPHLTVAENVNLAQLRVRKKSRREAEEMTMSMLKKVGITEKADSYPAQLSGGQQQRVAIARAMVNRPDILFADEPCANLDTESSRTVLDLFHRINEEQDQTIVMVSHEDWHKEYFHRIIRLRDGKIVDETGKK